MGSIRELSHTADIGFEVEAATVERLFELAAAGLLQALGFAPEPGPSEEEGERRAAGDAGPAGDAGAPGGDAGGESETIRLEKPDRERLLVAWLRELLYRCTSRRAIPSAVEVRTEGESALEARMEWRPWPEEGPVREIKGVTYHGLEVGPRDGGWRARVVLDV